MKRLLITVIALMVLVLAASGVSAATIDLFDWAFNVDGTKYESVQGTNNFSILPGYFNYAAFDQSTGLGTITITYNPGAGNYSLLSFFDHEIDQTTNTFFNEYGSASGSPIAGQSWEIGDPLGSIYTNFTSGTLTDTNNSPFPPMDYDSDGMIDDYDVSMAMGWNFNLLSGETATINFLLSGTAPSSGFYLAQTDPDSNETIYFSSTLNIQGGPQSVPEPSTLLLLGTALSGVFFFRKRIMK